VLFYRMASVRNETMVRMTKNVFPKIAAATMAGLTAGAIAALGTPAFAQGASLPEGAGKELVRSICQSCHDLSPITSAGFSRRDWEGVVETMIDMGAVIKPEEVTVIVNYLATSFPPKN